MIVARVHTFVVAFCLMIDKAAPWKREGLQQPVSTHCSSQTLLCNESARQLRQVNS